MNSQSLSVRQHVFFVNSLEELRKVRVFAAYNKSCDKRDVKVMHSFYLERVRERFIRQCLIKSTLGKISLSIRSSFVHFLKRSADSVKV